MNREGNDERGRERGAPLLIGYWIDIKSMFFVFDPSTESVIKGNFQNYQLDYNRELLKPFNNSYIPCP